MGPSGLTTHPSAPERRARNTSGRRSSSISTGTCSRLPYDSSRRSSRQTAIPPMFPIWRSTTTRSGRLSATSSSTAGPEPASRMAMSGRPAMAAISALTDGASLATRIERTDMRLARLLRRFGRRLSRKRGSPPIAEKQKIGDDLEPLEIVDIGVEKRNPGDRGGSDPGHQVAVGPLIPIRRRRITGQVVDEILQSPALRRCLTGDGRQLLQSAVVNEARLYPVDDEGGHRHIRLGQLAGEVHSLIDGVGLGCGHQNECRAGQGEEFTNPVRPGSESLLHPFELSLIHISEPTRLGM